MTSTGTTKVSDHDQDGAVTDTPDPSALPTKRQITVQEKLQFLADFEALSHGDKGEFLRANGLYSSQISEWRRARDAGTLGASVSRTRSENREIEKLTKKNQRLEDELERTRLALDIVGKAHALLEKLSKSADTD
jgi:transposase